MARCEDLTGSGVAGVPARTGDSEATGGRGSCPWLVAGAGDGGACWSLRYPQVDRDYLL